MRTFLAALALCVHASVAQADDVGRVSVAEILPALAGTELGAIDLGAAPVPGAVRVVRRGEVLAALSAHGRSAAGLAIPEVSRIRREPQSLARDEVARRARSAVEAALAPCAVRSVEARADAMLGPGTIEVRAEGPARPSGSTAMLTLVLSTADGRAVRIPAQAAIECPEAVVRSGARVSVRVAIGPVRASADGVARQSGRPGDIVRVTIERTNTAVQARVVDAATVEVVR
jgi:Chaperone for flagella basal body P-ring formation